MSDYLQLPHGFMDSPSCARALGIAPSRLRDMRAHGEGPRAAVFDGWRVAYAAIHVADYIASKAATHDLKAAELRASAAEVRKLGEHGAVVLMPSERPKSQGFVDANATGNPAEPRAATIRAANRKRREADEAMLREITS